MMSEKDFEDIICSYPELLEEGLVLKGRQITVYGRRMDILFEDKFGRKLIVELKRGPIKDAHIGQILSYEGMLLSGEDPTIRVMLVGNRVPPNIQRSLDHHGIACKEITLSQLKEFLTSRNDHVFLGLLEERGSGSEPVKKEHPIARPGNGERQARSPDGFKDIRQGHPTHEECEAHVVKTGDAADDGSVLANIAPLTLVKNWIQQTQMKDGVQLLQFVQGDYYRWEGRVYRKIDKTEIVGEWYKFFTDRRFRVKTADGVTIKILNPNRNFIRDLHDAASAYCNVRVDGGVHEPFLIKASAPMDLARAVVFQNGILYFMDNRLAPLTSDVFLTNTLPYAYRPGYPCPKWMSFVNDIFNADQECVELLQEWFGYNLIASNHMQSMMFFLGVPASGKSTTASILRVLLGDERCCGATTDNFKGLFGKGSLLNKYAAIMSESRDTNRSDIDKLLQAWKAITRGDVINVARKYRQAVDARPFCRLTYVANETIPLDDVSQATAPGTNLLYFPNDYRRNNPDRMLEEKLREEIPGIALWAIEGLKRLLANDRFTLPKESQVHLAQMAELTDPIGVMLAECTEVHIGTEFMKHRTECNTLYDLWKAWCDKTRTKTSLSKIGFGMKLAHMNRPIVRRQIMEAGQRMYVYQGLEVRPEAIERYLKR